MSADLPVDRAFVPRRMASPTSRLDRAYRLYRRRIGRCSTENQLNRIHIAIENYMTPAEARYFRTAVAEDTEDSPSSRWITRLDSTMAVNRIRPVEFERRAILRGVTRYTADDGSRDQKTLIIGFAGHFHRLMLPMPWLLGCLNPTLYDLVVLRDFSRNAFALGVSGLGGDLFEAVSNLRGHVDPRAYRNAISLGTSGGGVPALLAAILLGLHRGIAISPQDPDKVAAKLRANGLSGAPYAAAFASRPNPYPELVLVCGAEHVTDAAAANALHALFPSELVKVRGCTQHAVLAWHLERGTLPAFLAKILGQSLENRDVYAISPSIATRAAPPSGTADAGSRRGWIGGGLDHASPLKVHPKS